MENELTLSEKMLLLAIRPEKGGIFFVSSSPLNYCLIGALLLEMELTGTLRIQNNRTEVVRDFSMNPLHSYFLEKMLKSGRPRKIGHWLEPFVISGKRVRSELYHSLSQKKMIRLEDKRFLFFTWKKPWLTPSNPTRRLIDNLKNLMYQDPGNAGELYLAALLEPAELWGRIYREWSRRRTAKRKIRELLNNPQPTEALTHAAETARQVKRAIMATIAAHRAAAT